MTRLWALLRFELHYQLLRPASIAIFAAATLLLSGMSFAAVATQFGPDANAVNGAFVVTETMGLVSLLTVFALPMLCVQAALRDDESTMRELIGVTPTSAPLRWSVRFVGVLLVATLAVFIATAVQALAPHVLSLPAERVRPFALAPYVRAAVLLSLPNLVWSAAILFVVTVTTRSPLAVFVAAIALYAGYMVTALMVDSPLMAGTRAATPELMARAALLDPFGLSAFFEHTRSLTPRQQDVVPLALSGRLLINRVWVVLASLLMAAAGLALAVRRTPLGTRALARGRSGAARSAGAAPSATAMPYAPVPPTMGRAHWWATFRSIGRLKASQYLGSWALVALLVLWVAVIAIEADGQLKAGEYGTRVLATTAQLADAVPEALQWLGALVVIYFATDLFARERLVRFDGVRDATPVQSSAIVAGNIAALTVIPLALTLLGYGTTLVMHALAGGLPVEPLVLLMHVLVSLVPLLILTVLAGAVQAIVGQRWLAMFVSLALLLFAAAGDAIGATHPLLRFGAAPALRAWSTLDGYGTTLRSWLAFQGVWALGVVALGIAAAAVLERGTTLGVVERFRRLPRQWRVGLTGSGRRGLAASTGSFALAASALAWQTTVRHAFPSRTTAEARRVAYEQRYRRLANAPMPSLRHVEMHAALYPSRQRAEVHETLTLVNGSGRAVDTVWLSLPRDDERDAAWAVTGVIPTAQIVKDSANAVIALIPATPLAATDTLLVSMSVTLNRGGVRALPSAIDLTRDGTMLSSSALLPGIGYTPQRELGDSARRVALGLPLATPRFTPQADMDSLVHRTLVRGASPAWFTTRVDVTTDADQLALAPGTLEGKRFSADSTRVTFQYAGTQPRTPFFSIVSGRYGVHRTRVGDVPVEVWYTPKHRVPAERVLTVTADALATLQQQFGAYPHQILRVVEVQSGNRFGAYAEAGAIYLTESRGILTDARDGDVDLLRRRIGHEVAHEWWGHVVSPLDVEGRLLLVESVAKYAEQILAARAGGDSAVLSMLAFDHDRYMRGRANEEPPLVRVTEDPTWYYAKGALAFRAARVVLGETVLGDALRAVLTEQAGPYGVATAPDFVRQLHGAAPDSLRGLLDDWFAHTVLHEASADSASATAVAGGTRLRAWFHVQRIAVTHGEEVAAAADDTPVRVTITRARPADIGASEITLSVRSRGGRIALDTVLPVPRAQLQAVEIDRDWFLLDRDRSNNRVSLQPRRE